MKTGEEIFREVPRSIYFDLCKWHSFKDWFSYFIKIFHVLYYRDCIEYVKRLYFEMLVKISVPSVQKVSDFTEMSVCMSVSCVGKKCNGLIATKFFRKIATIENLVDVWKIFFVTLFIKTILVLLLKNQNYFNNMNKCFYMTVMGTCLTPLFVIKKNIRCVKKKIF